MPKIPHTEAAANFCKLLEDSQQDPVFISKDGEQVAVVISFDALRSLVQRSAKEPELERVRTLLAKSVRKYDGLYRVLSDLD